MKVGMETRTVREEKEFKNHLILLSPYMGENTWGPEKQTASNDVSLAGTRSLVSFVTDLPSKKK